MDVAVVTGAGRGLGAAIAQRLAGRGLAVLVTDLDGEAAAATAAALGEPAWGAALDVGDPDACRRVAEEAAGRGRLAVWVNNAGVTWGRHAWEHSDAEVETMVRTNLLGVVHGSRAAIAAMRERGGRILNVASTAALAPVPGLALYAATKHGVLAFSTSLQGDLRDAGVPIEVRAICPDPIDTRMVEEQLSQPEAALTFSAPRVMSADEVAERALALLYGRRVAAALPAWRGALARALWTAPTAALALLPAFKRRGDRNRERLRAGRS